MTCVSIADNARRWEGFSSKGREQDTAATISLAIVGFKVHVNVSINIFVGWSFAFSFGVVKNFPELLEKLMKHLNAIVFFGAALLPVPGWHKLH